MRTDERGFELMTYDQLWSAWAEDERAGWLREHVENLRARYAVAV